LHCGAFDSFSSNIAIRRYCIEITKPLYSVHLPPCPHNSHNRRPVVFATQESRPSYASTEYGTSKAKSSDPSTIWTTTPRPFPSTPLLRSSYRPLFSRSFNTSWSGRAEAGCCGAQSTSLPRHDASTSSRWCSPTCCLIYPTTPTSCCTTSCWNSRCLGNV